MGDEAQDRERSDRDWERSVQAHWRVAEAAAEEEERLLDAGAANAESGRSLPGPSDPARARSSRSARAS
jgi:hypothetical protein